MPKWTAQQQTAIEARGGSLLVSAAAGSGKTAVLVERVLRHLTDPVHPVDADRLLVVTFSNAAANEMRVSSSLNVSMRLEALPADKQPAACIGCGACSRACPQGIDIPAVLAELAGEVAKQPAWAELSRKREEAERQEFAGR